MAEELPRVVYFCMSHCSVELLHNNTGVLSQNQHSNFLSYSNSIGNGLLIFIKGYCISMLWNKTYVYIFDSHSKNETGNPVPDGTSVLLKFKSFDAVRSYIMDVYVGTAVNVLYDLQYLLKVELHLSSGETRNNIQGLTIKKKDRKRKLVPNLTLDNQTNRSKHSKFLEGNNSKINLNSRGTNDKRMTMKMENINRTLSDVDFSCCNDFDNLGTNFAIQLDNPNSKIVNRKKCVQPNSVQKFLNEIKCGPYFICVICHRCLYKRTVKVFNFEKYDNALLPPSYIKSHNNKKYICITCDKHLKKGSLPCQSISNKLQLMPIPPQLSTLNKLEKVLISKRILFTKIAIMPKGQQPKISGAICNIPINTDTITNCLPRAGADSVLGKPGSRLSKNYRDKKRSPQIFKSVAVNL